MIIRKFLLLLIKQNLKKLVKNFFSLIKKKIVIF